MSTHLLITVRWIGDQFHGFIDGTERLEWPPSPYRLFQALLAGAHRYGMDASRTEALAWIERQRNAPEVLGAPLPATGIIFDHWVPDNDDRLTHRRGSIRKFCPTLLGASRVVHYVWEIDVTDQPPLLALDELASSLGSLGWAVDQAYAAVRLSTGAQIDSALLQTDGLSRFKPAGKTTSTDGSLRVPRPGSMEDLQLCHASNRIAAMNQAERRRKKWPKVFDRVLYSSIDRPIARPHTVFKLLDENEDTFRHPHAKLIHIAGMVRHLSINAMRGEIGSRPWITDEWVSRVVRGKRDESAGDDHQQFSYVPLPSIGQYADAMIRNVMMVAPLGMERELNHVADRLDGLHLKPEGQVGSDPMLVRPVYLERFTPPPEKFIARRYLGAASVWETVTPVILDGHRKAKLDDAKAVARTTERLIRKALARAGIEAPCEFTWQMVPFFKNTLSAHERDKERRLTGYFRPDYLQGRSSIHVRLSFGRRDANGEASTWTPIKVSGPLMIGAGRHCGFGLLAVADMH